MKKAGYFVFWAIFYACLFAIGFMSHILKWWSVIPLSYVIGFSFFIRSKNCKECAKYFLYPPEGPTSLFQRFFPTPGDNCPECRPRVD